MSEIRAIKAVFKKEKKMLVNGTITVKRFL